jgi:hypothetical protein
MERPQSASFLKLGIFVDVRSMGAALLTDVIESRRPRTASTVRLSGSALKASQGEFLKSLPALIRRPPEFECQIALALLRQRQCSYGCVFPTVGEVMLPHLLEPLRRWQRLGTLLLSLKRPPHACIIDEKPPIQGPRRLCRRR